MCQLTNKVHQLLFSAESALTLSGSERNTSNFNIGVIPLGVLQKVLPEYITKECLVQLQYCQEISHKDVAVFSSLTQSDSTDQSFLFFPALCNVDKSDVSWTTPPDLSYSIGWMAQCTGPCDYFPPRFLHVLLLRLVFSFTLSVPSEILASPYHHHFQRRCTMWKTGVHWSMEEGVECMVELLSGNKEVLVVTKSEEDWRENCFSVFNHIIDCVMEAKAEFCHSVRPQFFLLDSTHEVEYHNPNNIFAMSDVERVLTSPVRKEIILSVNGKGRMRCDKILCLRKLTHWNSLFPIEFTSVLNLLRDLVRELYNLGLYLGVPRGNLEAIEADFPVSSDRRRRELVRVWMSSSPDPPCWWHLIQALRKIERSALAKEVEEKHGFHIQLQKTLLNPQNHSLKPDNSFLESFAGVVGAKWPSLAVSLSLSASETEVKLSQQDQALQILKKWAVREDATYGQLCQRLKTIQYGNE